MKALGKVLGFAVICFALNAQASDASQDIEDVKLILASPNFLSKVKPGQNLKAVLRHGESFDIQLMNEDQSCEQYSAMVLYGIVGSGSNWKKTYRVAIDENPSACK